MENKNKKIINTNWSTPQKFFDLLDSEFNFTIDVAASIENTKCKRYFTEVDDALLNDCAWAGETFWMNPPYGRGIDVYSWVEKAYYASLNPRTIGVCLLPASIDTKWFHEFCLKSYEIRFVRDRLWFSKDGISSRANHGSMVVVFSSITDQVPKISAISNGR